jgi:hypothetical protein
LMVLLLTRKKKMYVDLKSGRKANKKLVETGFAQIVGYNFPGRLLCNHSIHKKSRTNGLLFSAR